jgi:hypothetical protein
MNETIAVIVAFLQPGTFRFMGSSVSQNESDRYFSLNPARLTELSGRNI